MGFTFSHTFGRPTVGRRVVVNYLLADKLLVTKSHYVHERLFRLDLFVSLVSGCDSFAPWTFLVIFMNTY